MARSQVQSAGSLSDVSGVSVGHYQRRGRGWLSGSTVVLLDGGAVCGVDVRGGAPGTRETDLLRPENLVQQVHAICLTGGSAFGLSSATGVMDWLAERSIGFHVGERSDHVVPIVPGAVIFDLGRGGQWTNRPTAEFGYRAAHAARRTPCAEGTVGAGTGARSGGIKGGLGTASRTLDDGTVVSAIAVVNSIGSVIDIESGLPFIACAELQLRRPSSADRARLASAAAPAALPLNTTIGVVATSANLSQAEATKLAQVAHDGLARAVRPSHLMNDGDAIFAVATGTNLDDTHPIAAGASLPADRVRWLNQILASAADVFAIAATRGVVLAAGTPNFPSYRELCPTAFVAESRGALL